MAEDLLLVIDVQNDFCPGGALAVPEGDQVVPVINRLSADYRHIVMTQDWHPPGHQSFASSHAGKQPFEVIQLLLDARHLAFLLLDAILQAILLLAHAGEFFLELGTIPIQLHQFVAVFGFFARVSEYRSQAGQVSPR